MGCKASKSASAVVTAKGSSGGNGSAASGSLKKKKSRSPRKSKSRSSDADDAAAAPPKSPIKRKKSIPRPHNSPRPARSGEQDQHGGGESLASATGANSKVYRLLLQAQQQQLSSVTDENAVNSINLDKILSACNARQASYQNPNTGSTPLHLACRLLDYKCNNIQALFESLLRLNPEAVRVKDSNGNLPLHYAVAPTSDRASVDDHDSEDRYNKNKSVDWKARAAAVSLLLMTDPNVSKEYLLRNDVAFGPFSNGCSPLYRAIQALPDDFDSNGPTVEFMSIIRDASSELVGVGNSSDGDKPLALLYRRFTRQFDLAEKFFSGDNSRPEVVQHRLRYKTAAGNTWRIIELLLRPDDPKLRWRIVHRAVQVETPPDLLRYIVETNAEDLTVPDEVGNLPLHYAAKSKPPAARYGDKQTNFPAFYTKYVVDELLYKFPEAASMPDGEGNFPLTLAVRAGKQWIGGGIKSLYDAYPEALKQIDLDEHSSLQRALSLDINAESRDEDDDKEEKVDTDIKARSSKKADVIRDEHHDAIMLVQQPNVCVSEVITSMWAHEEDAGVQSKCDSLPQLVVTAPPFQT